MGHKPFAMGSLADGTSRACITKRPRSLDVSVPVNSRRRIAALDSSLKTMATLDMIRRAVGIDFFAAGLLK